MRTMKRLTIASLERRECKTPVHNLAVEGDESYVADGIVVHNCRSLLIPITKGDGWDGVDSPIPNVEPGEGFK